MSSKHRSSATGGLVYSTEHGRMCPACRASLAACTCTAAQAVPAGDGVARVGRETAGRRGKAVTVVRGVPLAPAQLADLGKALKAACGVGGTHKDGVIELQGDHVDRVLAELQSRGLRVRRAN